MTKAAISVSGGLGLGTLAGISGPPCTYALPLRFRGASDLVLDLQTVTIDGKPYTIDTADIGQKGRSGLGANKRTAEFTGGGAALGAIGAGAGAGAGAATPTLTKGGSIKVPVESVLTFQLDKPLKITAMQ